MKDKKEKNKEEKTKKIEKIKKENKSERKIKFEEKANTKKIIKNILIILFMVLISVLSFFGIYKLNAGEEKNIIRDYMYANDFNKYYEFVISPNRSAGEENVFIDKDGNIVRPVPNNEITQEEIELKEKQVDLGKIKKLTGDEDAKDYKVEKKAYRYNNPEVLNQEKFEETKNKIKKALADQKISSYNLREDLESGQLIFEVPQSEIKDPTNISKLLTQSGKFEVVDAQTDKPYITNKDIKDAKLMEHEQYGVILNVELKNDAKERFKEITQKYADKTQKIKEEQEKQKTENPENKENPITKTQIGHVEGAPELAIKLSGGLLQRGGVPKAIDNGVIQLSLGKPDPKSDAYQKQIEEISVAYTGLKVGAKPVYYNIDSQKLVEGNANLEKAQNIFAVISGIFLVMAISLVIFFKKKGFLSALSLITYLALMLLVVRYTNIYITVSVIVGILLLYILQFILLVILNIKYKEQNKIDLFGSYIKEYKELIVVLISAIILAFATFTELASYGKIVFLGMLLSLIYNYFITFNLLKD